MADAGRVGRDHGRVPGDAALEQADLHGDPRGRLPRGLALHRDPRRHRAARHHARVGDVQVDLERRQSLHGERPGPLPVAGAHAEQQPELALGPSGIGTSR